jgi:hypothetical protein
LILSGLRLEFGSQEVRASLMTLEIIFIVIVVGAAVVVFLGLIGPCPDGRVRKKANEKTELIEGDKL